MNSSVDQSPLGKKSSYINQYDPSLLFPIPRASKRDEIQVPSELPFKGYDIWNAFEISWLNLKGKPVVAVGEFVIPCESPCLVESKSFKLYLNSFNNSKFESFEQVSQLMQGDLSRASGAPVKVSLSGLSEVELKMSSFSGFCLDQLDVNCDSYVPDPSLLNVSDHFVEEVLFSNLLKSNCLVTGQPDWGSVEIRYSGMQIDREGLLKYIVSFRDHNEFHEQCVERIFMDLARFCKPEKLSVYARYTRRGGLDINPYRANYPLRDLENSRLIRQ